MPSKLAKLLAVAFAASMLLAIVGCSGGEESPEKSAEETTEATE